MFRVFFMSSRWCAWSIFGSGLILFAVWYQVELDVQINEWFGTFYSLIQKALGKPGSITMSEYLSQIMKFGRIAGLYVLIAAPHNAPLAGATASSDRICHSNTRSRLYTETQLS